jgi:hypothetical protein
VTSTLSPIVVAALTQNDYDALSATVGLIVILLLAVLIVGKEVVRANGGQVHAMGAFDLAIVPLLASAATVLTLRLLDLLV